MPQGQRTRIIFPTTSPSSGPRTNNSHNNGLNYRLHRVNKSRQGQSTFLSEVGSQGIDLQPWLLDSLQSLGVRRAACTLRRALDLSLGRQLSRFNHAMYHFQRGNPRFVPQQGQHHLPEANANNSRRPLAIDELLNEVPPRRFQRDERSVCGRFGYEQRIANHFQPPASAKLPLPIRAASSNANAPKHIQPLSTSTHVSRFTVHASRP